VPNKEEILIGCLERWNAADSRIQYFEKNFDEWFSQLPEDIQPIALQLLEMFEYYSQVKTNQYLKELWLRLGNADGYQHNSSLFTLLPSTYGIANSSFDYLYSFRQLNNISKYNVIVDLKTFISTKRKKFDSINNIVIVDDCCGSGNSLDTFIRNNIDNFRGKHIYYLITYYMKESKEIIDRIAEEQNIEIDVIFINSGSRAFDDDRFSDDRDNLRNVFERSSEELGIVKQYCLGKYKSEALISFYNNTPNNTIGLFWFDSDKYFSLFPREFENAEGLKRPTPQSMRQDKKKRNIQNYVSAARSTKYE